MSFPLEVTNIRFKYRPPLAWYQIISIIAAIVLPSSIFYIGGILWPTGESSGENVKARPPAKAFMWIWIVAILMIMISWSLISILPKLLLNGKKLTVDTKLLGVTSITFMLFIALAITWQYVYKEIGKKEATWVLWSDLAIGIWLIVLTLKANWVASMLMIVPVVWVLFAAMMNMLEVQNENKEAS